MLKTNSPKIARILTILILANPCISKAQEVTQQDGINDPSATITINQNDHPLKYVTGNYLERDKEVIKQSVAKDGMSLKYAHRDLARDKEVVMIAVKENGLALQYAHRDLRADFDIVLAAVTENGSALKYAKNNLTSNKDIALAAVNNYHNIQKNLNSKIIK